ncbi:MAG: gliding motility-associated C-terminal domain-containing protein [Prolixibacteraceae bacterium]|nr:gliding motility-associated C-terminal domain-containing protein [Prolixibacteraceae bacterium]
MNARKYIFLIFLFLIAVLQASGQYIVDKVCIDAQRNYRIEGEPGSTYLWLLYNSSGNQVPLSNPSGTPFSEVNSSGATIQGSEITIKWTQLGVFNLASVQYSVNGCDTTEQGEVHVFEQPQAFAGNPMTICAGSPVNLNTSTAAHYSSLLWTTSGDGTFSDATILRPVYTPGPNDILTENVTLTLTAQGLGNGNSCYPATSNVKVTIINLTATAEKTDITCFAKNDGTLTVLNPKGGSGTYQFTIDGVLWAASTNFPNLLPGTYQVKMRDALFPICSVDLGSFTIIEPPKLDAVVDFTNATCLGNDGTITLSSPVGGWGTYEFSIDNINWQSDLKFINLVAGIYPVSIRDAKYTDCVISLKTVTITEPIKLSASAKGTDVTCFGANDGIIEISNAIGGSGIHQFSIDGTIWSSTLKYIGLAPGDYTVQMRDAIITACVVNIATITISQPLQLNALVVPQDITCFGLNDGKITLDNPSGGSGNYAYSLDGVKWQVQNQFANLSPGNYQVQIRDDSAPGCIVMLTPVTIVEPPQLKAVLDKKDITCFGSTDGIITVLNPTGGTGSHEFSIDGTTWVKTTDFKNLTKGSYLVQMRDAIYTYCMVDLGTIVIIEPPILHADVSHTNTTCVGTDGTITFSNSSGGSGNYQYTINGTNWFNSGSFIDLLPNTYYLQIRDANAVGCIIDLGSVIILPPVPLAATAVKTDVTCFGGSDGKITISGASGGSGVYEFSADGTTWVKTNTITNLLPGNYLVKMRDAITTACVIDLATLTISEPLKLNADLTASMVTCYQGTDGQIVISNATGGSGLYEYSVDGTTWTSTTTLGNLPKGTYTVRIRDANAISCIINLPSVTITEPAQLQATIAPQNVTCFGGSNGSIILSNPSGGSGSFQYSINGSPWGTLMAFNGLSKGTYKIEMRDANVLTCFRTLADVIITEPAILAADVIHTNTTCSGNDGTITISNSKGGSGSYQYSIDNTNWQNITLFSGLTPGIYQVQIRDVADNSCIVLLQTINIQPAVVLAATTDHLDITCFGANDGKISFQNPSGGSGVYEFTINNGVNWQPSPLFENLAPGTYVLQIRDANSTTCVQAIPNITLTQPNILAAIVTSTDETFTGANDGSITVSAPSGGSGVYNFSIDGTNWQNSGTFTNLSPKTYDVWIRDGLNVTCIVKIKTQIVTTTVPLIANVTPKDISCFGSNDGEITVDPTSGPAGNYEYSNDGGINWQNSRNFNGLPPADYVVMMRYKAVPAYQVTLATVRINSPGQLTATLTATKETYLGANDGIITVLSPAGGSGSYQFSKDGTIWQSSPTFTGLVPQTYSILMRDAVVPSCFISLGSIEVVKGSLINANMSATPVTCFGGSDGSITFKDMAGGSGTYQFSIDNGTTWFPTPIFTGLTAKNYPVKIRDAAATAVEITLGTVLITQPPQLVVSVTLDAPIPIFGGTTKVTVTASGGKAPYVGTGTFTVSSGTHPFAVTDANNCNGSASITVTEPGAMTMAAAGVDSPCSGINGSIQFTFTNVPDGTYTILYDAGVFNNVSISGNKASVTAPVGFYNNLKLSGFITTNGLSITIKTLPMMTMSVTPSHSNCSGENGSLVFSFKNVPDGIYDITYDGGKFTGVQIISNQATVKALAGTYKNLELVISCPPAKVSQVILNPPLGLLPIASVTRQPDCFIPTGTVVVSYPKIGTGYQYSVDGGTYQNSDTFAGLITGPHKFRAKEIATGCLSEEITLNINLIPSGPVSPTAFITKLPDCEIPFGTILVTSPSGPGYEYNIDGGAFQSSSTFTSVAPGIHQLRVRSTVTGCESAPRAITIDPVPPQRAAPIASVIQPDCYLPTGTITVTDPPFNTGYLYSLDGINYQPSATFTNLVPGTYKLRVRPVINKCDSEIKELTINQPVPPAAPTASNQTECEQLSLVLTAVATPPTGATVVWYDAPTGGNVVTNPTLSTPTSKIYYAQSVLGSCVSSTRTAVTLTILPALAPPAASDQTECLKTPVQTLTATATPPTGATVVWYDAPSGGNIVANPTLNSVGEKTYYAQSKNGCISLVRTPVKLTILPVPPPPVLIIPEIKECETNPIQTLNANVGINLPPGATVIWYDKLTGGNIVSQPILNSVGTITYYAESAIGVCSGSPRIPVTLTIVPMPPAPVSLGDLNACDSNPQVTLDARSAIPTGPGQNIRWFDQPVGGNLVVSPTLNQVKSITYYAEDFNGLCSSSPRTPVTLTISPLPAQPVAKVTTKPTCKDTDGIIEVLSPLGNNFSYSLNNGPYQLSPLFSEPSGNHFIRVKNTMTNCESDTTVIKVPDIPPVPKMKTVKVEDCICYGDSGSINFEFENVADGTYVIIYLGGKFENVQVKNNKAIVKAPAGTYNVLAIEANGCTSTESWSIVIDQPDRITVSAVITEIDLKSNTKGSIEIAISGGTGLYQTVWAPNPTSLFAGATTQNIYNLNDGKYAVTITDQNGCQQRDTLVIPLPNHPPIASNDEFYAGCSGVSGDIIYADNGFGKDYDQDGDTLFVDFTLIEIPKHGTLVLNPDQSGKFTYTADQGYTGLDQFQYVVFDVKKNTSNPGKVIIHVVADFDCDGIEDTMDPDADADGILNLDEGSLTTDTDGDGHFNWLDIDADNDGIVDNFEGQSTSGYIAPLNIDTDHDGIDNAYDTDHGGTVVVPVDTDGDGIPDFLDVDSDNDFVPDYIEGHDFNADGKPDFVLRGKDMDTDGLDDGFDTVFRYTSYDTNMTGSNAAMQDFDGDGKKDWRDENDDDDEYLTRFEDLNIDGDYSNDDTDFDGHPEYLDFGRDCDLLIPEAFSPNDDNIHDYFQIYCINHFPNARMFIFDQLGNKLYEKEHYGNMEFWETPEKAWWDGRTSNRSATTINGKVAPGTYYYVLQLGNGEVRKSFVFVSY